MPATSIVGLDTAKNVFQLHGADREGKLTFKKRLRRGQVTDFFANLPPCVIGLEATQGAHHWARVLETFGHTVRLVAPQFVKPYLQSQKNDANDAAAICEAVSRPQKRFVPKKTIEQQDLQALHRIQPLMRHAVSCSSQVTPGWSYRCAQLLWPLTPPPLYERERKNWNRARRSNSDARTLMNGRLPLGWKKRGSIPRPVLRPPRYYRRTAR
jgi:hypothetical protein